MKQKKFGQILVEDKLLSQPQLVEALREQSDLNAKSKRKFKLGEILLFCKLISLGQLQRALLRQKGNQSLRG